MNELSVGLNIMNKMKIIGMEFIRKYSFSYFRLADWNNEHWIVSIFQTNQNFKFSIRVLPCDRRLFD